MTRLIGLLLLCLASLPATAEALRASIERSSLQLGESLELLLEADDPTLFGLPDLSPLEQDFELLGTRKENHSASLDGSRPAVSRWIISLQPRRSGALSIPALQLGDAHSQPLSLQVAERAATQPQGPIFIDAQLDQDSVYVQAQAVLTLRIYHALSLYDDNSLSALNAPDLRVEQLGELRTYETRLKGVPHGVIEVRYALFPQRSGLIRIPAQQFIARPVLRNPGDGPGSFSRPGRSMRIDGPALQLQVKPQPDSWPAGAPWLPAQSLNLQEHWNPQPGHLQIGDSLTRRLSLQALGVSSAQLPALGDSPVAGLRRYPEPPQLRNHIDEQGLLGSREESHALLPEQAGELQLPAIQLYWWNTRSDRLEVARLPAHSLHVSPAPQPPAAAATSPVAASEAPLLWPWQLACALLALGNLLGFALWWHARHQPAVQPVAASGPSPRSLLDDLKRACLAGDPQASRQALDAWARQQPSTLAELASRHPELAQALDALNGALYSESSQHWQGENLWQAVRQLPADDSPASSDETPLPPLYPR